MYPDARLSLAHQAFLLSNALILSSFFTYQE